ncbi:MAG: hypothetical protein MCSN_5660 [Candidatus Microsyncoccus archaeolyticus]|jgi:hypothetical protein|nr:MAG: hypothetical protein MCSN_5660 [Candidatus Parcubacteria bacterium]
MKDNNQLLKEVKKEKESNPKIAKVFDIFKRSQEIYEESMSATQVYQKPVNRGTYSSSISEKDYYANISTTTQ